MNAGLTAPNPKTIRPAALNDLPGLTWMIHKIANEDDLVGLGPNLTNRTITSQILEKILTCPNSHLILAADNGDVIGMACAAPSGFPDTSNLSIGICVLNEYSGQGIGSLLLNSIIQWCEKSNKRRLSLSVLEHNSGAIRLYKKFGFSSIEKKKTAHIKNGRFLQEIIMEKIISAI